jgi:hypothetical protein
MGLKLTGEQRKGLGTGCPVTIATSFFGVGENFITMFVMVKQRLCGRHYFGAPVVQVPILATA